VSDIILDTNAFRIFIDKDAQRFIDNVVKKCDRIYVPNNIYKELRGRFFGNINLIYSYLRKLEKKFHIKSSLENVQLPDYIEDQLENNNADEFDKKLAKLAFKRSKEGSEVYLISSDRCFINTSVLFERFKIHVKSYEEFKEEYLSSQ
jgi:rRNA-processing protein FCF1